MHRSFLFEGAAAAAAGYTPHTVSVDTDGGVEYFLNSTEQGIGIADNWTIMLTVKPADIVNDSCRTFVVENNPDDNSRLWIVQLKGVGKCRVELREDDASTLKQYNWDSGWWANAWVHSVFTWNGTTGDVLLGYKNGTAIVPDDKAVDLTGAMDDYSRQVSTAAIGGTIPFQGRMHQIAVWNTVLDQANITAIYNGGDADSMNLLADSGNYDQSSALMHWWKFGEESTDIGKDFGSAGTTIDLMANAVGITDADIVTDSPGA